MFCDAHNHLQDRRLDSFRDEIIAKVSQLGIRDAVINGTQESDWGRVAHLAEQHPWVTPSYGLHPWYVTGRSEHWLESLSDRLDADSTAAIGEIGLDRWVKEYDLPLQISVFTSQLRIAAARNLPVTIHCLKAWGALSEVMHSETVPARGFLLHAYGGPAEMVRGFLERGAYFSFSTYFLHERKITQREIFRHLPLDRLLVETDSPDMAPPLDRSLSALKDSESGTVLNHPANLLSAYEELARLRGLELEELADQVASNYARLFGT